MTDSSSAEGTTATNTDTRKRKSRFIAAASAVGGMIVGSIVGIAVQVGVESTGILGPGVESLLAEQEANFAGINDRLDALQIPLDQLLGAELTALHPVVKSGDAIHVLSSPPDTAIPSVLIASKFQRKYSLNRPELS